MDSLETLVQDRRRLRNDPAEAAYGGLPTSAPSAGALSAPSTTHPILGDHPRDGSLLHGRYRLLERLGAGGFGVVWRAQDELLHREVALKRIPLPPDLPAQDGDAQPRAGERASREALAAARLAHPAIVALYEAYVDDDAFYLVSELVHGKTLARLIADDELSDEEILEIGVALAQALAHAHARGVIHRDIKPQNVLVPEDPDAHEAPAKLTDFGGASLSGGDALTRTGETLGTLAYMAPEQSEGREVSEAADLYSLALVLYEGLTGVNPVRGGTPAATARRIGRPLPPFASRRPDLPRRLSDALDAALSIDPVQRGTLEDLRAGIEQVLAEGLARGRGLQRLRIARIARAPAARHDGDGTPTAAYVAASHHAASAPGANRAIPEYEIDPDGRRAPSEDAAPRDAAPGAVRSFPVPRAIWLGCVVALAAWQVARGHPGVALLLVTAAAPLLLMGSRPGLGWLTASLAPLLGLVGLAGAYPALAGQASSWSRRALLGALGYVWLVLAEPLLAGGSSVSRLWLGPPAGMPARTVWEGSLDSAATHVVGPSLTAGLLFGAILWAVAAVALPWLVRGSSALLDTLAAVAWSAVLLAATPYFAAALRTGAALPHPRGAVLGAILAAAIAVAARALRGPISVRHP